MLIQIYLQERWYECLHAFAKANKTHLIHWFYKQQSKGQRYHLKNRLFMVVYDPDGEHWKLKAELGILKDKISAFPESIATKLKLPPKSKTSKEVK